ncbi:hypothetical protein C5167_047689 [Papaver somniferum]|uniref:Uncharacterized protein n=1 Tax=Papaver somniferum TaxID=3469 RepID=A0A4Y7LIY2_PAPSO|nr:ribonuclease 1-like [Papaver somniferum]RZC84907.1 hypothetical protein C5167_047689 [Papaver somniferum]
MKLFTSVLLLLLVFSNSIFICNSQAGRFKYYILAVQFTRSLCNCQGTPGFYSCDPKWKQDLPTTFSIHGLWENDWYGVKQSSAKKFNLFEIISDATLRNGLYRDWVDAHVIYKSSNKDADRRAAAERFWKSEWDKHGIFTGLTVHEYFRTTSNLFSSVGNIYARFQQDGLIMPGGKIDLNDVMNTLTIMLGGFSPKLKCIANQFGEEFLYEVEFLYDRATLVRLNHFNPTFRGSCTSDIVSLKVN